jgi:hypothetical protein
MEFITFQGKEYVRLKWANKKQEEWVEKSEYMPKTRSFVFYQARRIVGQPI